MGHFRTSPCGSSLSVRSARDPAKLFGDGSINDAAAGLSVRSLRVTATTGSGLPMATGSAHNDQRALRDALAAGALPIGLRQQIAIAVATTNGCNVCLVSQIRHGRAAGLVDDEIAKAQNATSADPASAAALGFARMLLDRRCHVSDAEMAAVRAAGFDDGAIAEIAAAVALNMFANLVNNLARDPPTPEKLSAARPWLPRSTEADRTSPAEVGYG